MELPTFDAILRSLETSISYTETTIRATNVETPTAIINNAEYIAIQHGRLDAFNAIYEYVQICSQDVTGRGHEHLTMLVVKCAGRYASHLTYNGALDQKRQIARTQCAMQFLEDYLYGHMA